MFRYRKYRVRTDNGQDIVSFFRDMAGNEVYYTMADALVKLNEKNAQHYHVKFWLDPSDAE
jgi:hypothetical protein